MLPHYDMPVPLGWGSIEIPQANVSLITITQIGSQLPNPFPSEPVR